MTTMTHATAHNVLLLTFPFDAALNSHPSILALVGWVAGMLSYRQDVSLHVKGLGVLSQLFSIICLVALLVFGVTREEWCNFLVVPALTWLHFQLTKRWLARPGAWW
jgi:hypothetical protein